MVSIVDINFYVMVNIECCKVYINILYSLILKNHVYEKQLKIIVTKDKIFYIFSYVEFIDI